MIYSRNKALLILLLFTSILVSCKKGDVGPAGPIGPQGPQGTQGTQGPKGDPGTANVIYSNWATLIHNTRDSSIDAITRRINHIHVPALTPEIRDRGVILVYMRFTAALIIPLPYQHHDGVGATSMDFFAVQQKIIISRHYTSTRTPVGWNASMQFRYIIIPGGTLAGARNIDPKTLDYETVKQLYNIPD
jgi:hypothetical protein